MLTHTLDAAIETLGREIYVNPIDVGTDGLWHPLKIQIDAARHLKKDRYITTPQWVKTYFLAILHGSSHFEYRYFRIIFDAVESVYLYL